MMRLFLAASLAHASLAVSRPSLDALLKTDNDVCFFQKGMSTLQEGVAHRGTAGTASTILGKASHALSNFFFGPRHVNAITENVEDLASNASRNQTSRESASNTHEVNGNQLPVVIAKRHKNNATLKLSAKANSPKHSQITMGATGSEQFNATLNLLATHRQQADTSSATEELLGVRSLFESQSQFANEVNLKVEELKTNIGKVGTSSRKRFNGARNKYHSRLQKRQRNTTFIRSTNKQIRADIKALALINAKLRQQAENLKNQSLTLREQVTAAESQINLARKFAATSISADSDVDTQFLEDLRKNESEFIKAQARDSALASFGDRNSMSFLQLDGDMGPADLLRTLQSKLRELSEQEKVGMGSLEQEFKQRLKEETIVQDSLLAEQRKLLEDKETQLAIQSKLSSAVDHLKQMKNYLNNKLGHLRLYALRLSEQNS